jgi:MoaA/NifB/PqqE/SkfB family radical SAM enzyme
MENQKVSFTSADTFPYKIFLDEDTLNSIKNKRILPIHIQLNPTNKCNQSCSFCSCSLRDKNAEIPLKMLLDIIERMYHLGTKAATITGAGEPTCYTYLDKAIDFLSQKGIKIGLVTNGIELPKIRQSLAHLTWCRISLSDEQRATDNFLHSLLSLKKEFPFLDWSFSYVVTRKFDPDNLKKIIELALQNDYAHLRIVSNLVDLASIPDIESFLSAFAEYNGRIIYQKRKAYSHGRNPCYISLLKPNIGPDGNIYPCCGVQYALPKATLDFPSSMSMGKDIEDLYAKQRYFNGQICQRCYYDQYNSIIALLFADLKHKEFI